MMPCPVPSEGMARLKVWISQRRHDRASRSEFDTVGQVVNAEPDLDAADAGPAACGAPHDNDDLGDYGNPGHGYRVGLGEFDQTAELASAGGT